MKSPAVPLAVVGLIAGLLWLTAGGCAGPGAGTGSGSGRLRTAGSWDARTLSSVPAVTWGRTDGLVQELYYEGEPLAGRPTRVFAYLARPVSSAVLGRSAASAVTTVTASVPGEPTAGRGAPAMVLVHGGGGKAFRDWAQHWAARGYVALAMDLSGNGPAGKLPDGGPDQADSVKFRPFADHEAREMWTHHAVGAVIRGHSLLRSLPEVDANRVGLTGISWGGYLTCIVAGIDGRFRVSVPVYGCGFLGDNSVWKDGALAALAPEQRERWLRWFDPSQYVGGVRHPILFVNGTTDFAYPLDSYRKTYRLVAERRRRLSVAINRPHGHIWTFPEVDAFVDHVLRQGPAPVRIGPPIVVPSSPGTGGGAVGEVQLTATLDRMAGLTSPTLCYTTDAGPWPKRRWASIPARLEDGRVVAPLPAGRPLVAFLSVQDAAAGGPLTSEHVDLP